MSNIGIIESIYSKLTTYLQSDILKLASGQAEFVPPHISFDDLIVLLTLVQSIFKKEDIVLNLSSPVAVCGDIHGHFLDLLRIISAVGESKSYLFLGDLIDRGEFSLETCALIFSMKCLHPNNVFIIRGNHEFDAICSKNVFSSDLDSIYSDCRIYQAFLSAFSYMPIAAKINNEIFCVHGGIGPDVNYLSQLNLISRPIHGFGNTICDPLFWSDPSEDVEEYEPSPRGNGYLFGEQPLYEFLEYNRCSVLVRGHECIEEGVKYMFQGKVITVFSASNYCGRSKNKCGILLIDKEIKSITLEPLDYLLRQKKINIRNQQEISN